jgi:hypothetical protein
VEAAEADLDAALAQRARDVEGTGKLVRLYADQHDHAGAGRFDQRRDAVGADARVGLVEGVDVDVDVLAQALALRAVAGKPVQRGERV